MKKIILAFSILLLAAGCGSTVTNSNDQVAAPNNNPAGQQSNAAQQSSTAPNPAPKTPTPAGTSVVNVSISNFAFAPQAITVKQGTKVVWTNKDTVAHTITGDNGGPSSSPLATDQSYSYTFNQAGTFSYHCAIHPAMTATVLVTQ